jgi:hypothetical protein
MGKLPAFFLMLYLLFVLATTVTQTTTMTVSTTPEHYNQPPNIGAVMATTAAAGIFLKKITLTFISSKH